MLREGDEVEIFGLQSASGILLNGKTGRLTRHDDANGRWGVLVGEGKAVAIRPSNIRKKKDSTADTEDSGHTVAVQCGVCLDVLRAPCTLPCGHNFCIQCARSALETVSRCPTCRAAVPDAAAAMLTPNLLLSELVRAQQGVGDDDAGAAPAEAALSRQRQRPARADWTLFVDFLSPACLSVLAVVEALRIDVRQFNLKKSIQTHCSLCQEEVTATKDTDVYICDQCGEHVTPQQPTASPANQLRLQEQRTVWCDDVKKCEFEKPMRAQCVPRLEHGGDLVLTEPSSVVSTIVEVWGQGRLGLGPTISFATRAAIKQCVAEVWGRLIRPVSMHLFSHCWEDAMCGKWFLKDFTQALEWTNSSVVPLLLATRKSGGELTLLDYLAAAPLALLIATKSSMVQEAAGCLPALRDWLQHVINNPSIQRALGRRKTPANAKQLAHYAESLPRHETMSKISNSDMFGKYFHRHRGRQEELAERGPPKVHTWPYDDVHRLSRGDQDEDPFGKELPFDVYLRERGNLLPSHGEPEAQHWSDERW